MLRIRRRTPVIPLLIVLFLYLSNPSWLSAQPQTGGTAEKITLQLRWECEFQFAGFIAAKELGYYRDAGLDVDVKPFVFGMDMYDELRSGRAHYTIGTTSALVERNNGLPVVAIAAIFQHSPLIIISYRDKNIHSPADLVGGKVALYHLENTIISAIFRSEGIDSRQIEIVEYDPEYKSLLDGSIDATTGMTTIHPYLFRQMGFPTSIMRPQTYGIDFYGNTLLTTESEIEKHPERVRAFRKASLQGWTYAMSHTGEIIDLMLDKYDSGRTREQLAFEAAAMAEVMESDLVAIGHMNPGRWQYILDVYKEQGMVSPGFSLDGFLYDPESTEDISELTRLLKILGGSLAVLSVIVLSLVAITRRLQQTKREKEQMIDELQTALSEIRTLREMLPICSSCKKIRNDEGYWENVDAYISKHTDAKFSHGICPDCLKKLYPEYDPDKNKKRGESSDG